MREGDHKPKFRAEVKNEWNKTLLPYDHHGFHGNNLTFNISACLKTVQDIFPDTYRQVPKDITGIFES